MRRLIVLNITSIHTVTEDQPDSSDLLLTSCVLFIIRSGERSQRPTSQGTMSRWHGQPFNAEIQKRASSDCPSGVFTALDGLDFDMYCDQDLLSNNIPNSSPIPHSNVLACMQQCAILRPICYGVAFDSDNGNCYFKDSSTTPSNLTANTSYQSAIANSSQVLPLNTTCPYFPNSYQSTSDSMEFEILCGLDMPYGDYCPDSSVSCPLHADTLEECMEFCSMSHPLCLGISWNPDMTNGYANCYLKNSQTGTPVTSTAAINHSALARLDQANTSCPSNTTYISSDSKIFDLSCNTGRLLSTNTSSHVDQLDGCIDKCATNATQNCLGIVFDASMQYGFENCYLLNSTGQPTSIANSTYAEFASGNNIISSPPSTPGSSSKAWIAGLVIGIIVLAALLTGLLLWQRKRSARTADPPLMELANPKQRSKYQDQVYQAHELQDRENLVHELNPSPEPIVELYDEHNNLHELWTDSQPHGIR